MTALAFGGTYDRTLVVPAIVCVALAAVYLRSVPGRGAARSLDRLLLLALLTSLIQLVPLPRGLLSWLTPASEAVAQTLRLADTGGALPISIDVSASGAAAALYAGVLLLFFTARDIFSGGGVRTTTRALAATGIVLALVAIAQDATGRGLMYWHWKTMDDGPAPFGPFVNRNHFASWAIMVVPLCLGYLMAHAAAHPAIASHANWRRRIVAALDARAGLLLASAALLILAVAVSLSRSGLAGLAAALLAGAGLARRFSQGGLDSDSRRTRLIAAVGGFALLAVGLRVGSSAILGRLAASDVAMADRVTIWRETIPVLKDFWLTGTGIGTYETAMAIYQRSSPGVLFNQAHNHFLQVAAEGGLLVAAPILLGIGAFASMAWHSLRSDRSGMFWFRAGAASGLFGVAVQSLWETGLTTPANAALAAVLAAIVLHVPARSGPPSSR